MFARLRTWLNQPFQSKPFEMPDIGWTRGIGGRVAFLEDDGVDSPAKRAWREGGTIPPAPPTPRWQMLLGVVVYLAFFAALAFALLLAHLTFLAVIAVGGGVVGFLTILYLIGSMDRV